MANQDIQKLDEGHRLILSQAGLDEALALFPSDIFVAVRTAMHVRESFATLINSDHDLAQRPQELTQHD